MSPASQLERLTGPIRSLVQPPRQKGEADEFQTRKPFYKKIEQERNSKVILFATSDRPGMDTQIAQDCVNSFVEILDKIGPTERIYLILHTNGGDTLTAWRLINLIRSFCDEIEVIIPLKALSAGTLISIGADRLLMTKQAALGPIDPSVNGPLNPQINFGNQLARIPISVESVRGNLDAAREELGIKGEKELSQILIHLSSQIHPLVIGDIFRSRTQIRYLAGKLLERQVSDAEKSKTIIDFLCADSGSHDYTINRREASKLGLNIEKPSTAFCALLKKFYQSYVDEMKLFQPYNPEVALGPQPAIILKEVRGLVESLGSGCYGYMTEGTLTRTQVQTPMGAQDAINDQRSFEGWKKIA